MLGAEPVVHGDDLGARPPADLRGQVGGEEGVPQHVHAAMEVQNNMPKFDSVDGDLGGRGRHPVRLRSRSHRPAAAAPMTTPGAAAAARRRRCRQGRLTAAGLLRGSHAARYSRRISPSVGIGWAAHPGGLARVKPLLKFPAGRRAIASLAARQVTRRHRITVIRAAGAPQNRSTTDRREYAGSGPLLPSPWIALLHPRTEAWRAGADHPGAVAGLPVGRGLPRGWPWCARQVTLTRDAWTRRPLTWRSPGGTPRRRRQVVGVASRWRSRR